MMSSFDSLLADLGRKAARPKKKRRKTSSAVDSSNDLNTSISTGARSSRNPSLSSFPFPPHSNFDDCQSKGVFPPLSPPLPPVSSPCGPVLIGKCLNEQFLMPSFIDHYVALGVCAVILLDNGSTDLTLQIAHEKLFQVGVPLYVFASSQNIKSAESSWFQILASTYCLNRWVLFSDIDELFTYHSCETLTLHQLTTYLTRINQAAVTSYLLDVYSDQPLSSSPAPETHRYYDSVLSSPPPSSPPPSDDFYATHKILLSLTRKSMVRARLTLAQSNFVYAEKSPLVYFTKKSTISAGHHRFYNSSRLVSYAADESTDLNDPTQHKFFSPECPPFTSPPPKYVQGIVIHRCFANPPSYRSRYLLDQHLKSHTISTLSSPTLNPYDPNISKALTNSRELPYRHPQSFIPDSLPSPHRHITNFMGIGAQKAGTSWLHKMLSMHPSISMAAPDKETHFFDWHRSKGLDYYSSLFPPTANPTTLKGEVTPDYVVLPPATISSIRKLYPGLKLIFLARDIIDRSWSAVKMELRNEVHGVSAGVFADKSVYTTMDMADPSKYKNSYFLERMKSETHWSRSDYASGLRNWLKYFPASQILILDFDRISRDPRELLKDACEFLSIDYDLLEQLPDDVVGAKVNEQISTSTTTAATFSSSQDEIRPKLLEAMRTLYDPLTADFNALLKELGYGWQLS